MTVSSNNHDRKVAKSISLEEKVEELWAAKQLSPVGAYDEFAAKSEVLEALEKLTTEVTEIVSQQKILCSQNQLQLQQMQMMLNSSAAGAWLPGGEFLKRLYHDRIYEKDQISRFVATTFFSRGDEPQRCFVQASTLAVRLAYVLNSEPTVHPSSLIHTNSAVAHLPLLYGEGDGRISIWPCSNRIFDQTCGGWQPAPGDHEAEAYVRSLFTRDEAKLRTSFLMPVFVTPNDGIFYERDDASRFADVLAEAPEVVVLATGNRLMASRNAIPEERRMRTFAALRGLSESERQKITLVATHPTEDVENADATRDAFRGAFGKTHWCMPDGTWHTI